MPVLARTLEAAGVSTVLLTNMPFWAEKVGTPRTLAVEFPFGHLLGASGDAAQQMRVIREALKVLENTQNPGEIIHSTEVWPEPLEEAQKSWQPPEPSPVIAVMGPKLREMLREQRKRKE